MLKWFVGIDRIGVAPLQAAFNDDQNLTRFFNGRSVERQPVSNDAGGSPSGLDEVDDGLFPNVTVRLRMGIRHTQAYGTPPGAPYSVHVVAHESHFGFIEMTVEGLPGFTVQVVQRVFGPDAEKARDDGITSHGVTYLPNRKGTVAYRIQTPLPGLFPPIGKKSAEFYIALPKWPDPTAGSGYRREQRAIHDDDLVANLRIESYED